jgi:cold shock protein
MEVKRSIVKWFDARKGFGFIVDPTGHQDIFVHYSAIATDQRFKSLRTGQIVDFQIYEGPKGPHAQAVTVTDEEITPELLALQQQIAIEV